MLHGVVEYFLFTLYISVNRYLIALIVWICCSAELLKAEDYVCLIVLMAHILQMKSKGRPEGFLQTVDILVD